LNGFSKEVSLLLSLANLNALKGVAEQLGIFIQLVLSAANVSVNF
jgi:hypothetical protein